MHEFLVGEVESDGNEEGEDEKADHQLPPGEGACSTAQSSRALGPLQDAFSIPARQIQLITSNRDKQIQRERERESEKHIQRYRHYRDKQ